MTKTRVGSARPLKIEKLKPLRRQKGAEKPATLTPPEYAACVWVGRWAEVEEIAQRLRLPDSEVEWLIRSAMRVKGCRTVAELREMFEPDWSRLDEVPESRWEKAGNRWVLRGSEQARAQARASYAEKRSRNWKRLLGK